LKIFSQQTIRSTLVGRGNLRNLLSDRFTEIDPYSKVASVQAKQIFNKEAQDAWGRIKNLFAHTSPLIAYENTWASIIHIPELTYFIYQGVKQDKTVKINKRVNELAKSVKESWLDDPLIKEIYFKNLIPDNLTKTPNLLELKGFSSDQKIRFGLGNQVNLNNSWFNLLETVATIKPISASEIANFLIEFSTKTKLENIKKITFRESSKLSDQAYEIFISNQSLIDLAYPKKNRRLEQVDKSINSLRDQYKSANKNIEQVIKYMNLKNWYEAGLIGETLTVNQITKLAAVEQIKNGLNDQFESNNKWVPMSELGFSNLNKIFNSIQLKKIYAQDAKEIARQVILHKLSFLDFSKSEINQLNITWEADLKKKIIESGQHEFILSNSEVWSKVSLISIIRKSLEDQESGYDFLYNQMSRFKSPKLFLKCLVEINQPEALILVSEVVRRYLWINNRSSNKNDYRFLYWEFWIAKLIGTNEWIKARELNVVESVSFEQVLYISKYHPENLSNKNLQKEIIELFKFSNSISEDIAKELLAWFASDISCLAYIGKHIKKEHFNTFLALTKQDSSFNRLITLYPYVDKDLKEPFWNTLLKRVEQANDLIPLLMDGIHENYNLDLFSSWNKIQGSTNDRVRALVLAAKNDFSRLKKIRHVYGDQNMSEALFWCAKQLPERLKFERVLLELMSVLGIRSASTINWLLIQRNFKAAPGSRLEHLYRTHEIPKKSGLMRTISVPDPGLKRIQRSILIHLLTPLGAHENAFGFVKNKSIIDNAKCHIKQQVVVNADVKNCFPSVSWPLVLTSLKRDLSNQLSDKTISALVDICTNRGGLPIGAPTSPALLNRVLLKTDIILTEKAEKRNCHYSRYADDLTFSGGDNVVSLLGVAKSVIGKIGLEFDENKTNIFRVGRRQMCTGLVVNEKVNIPRRIRRRIRASVHAYEQGKQLYWEGEQSNSSSLQGRISYMHMVDENQADKLLVRFQAVKSLIKK